MTRIVATILWIFVHLLILVSAKPCPGFCTNDVANCTGHGGKVVGYCANEMACCDVTAGVTGTCGANFKRLDVTYFQSPQFPQNSSGDLICDFSLKLSDKSVGIRLDFVQFESDERGYGEETPCDTDLFFVRGFQTWMPPPRCGKLTGYSVVIDRKETHAKDLTVLSLLAVMSSPAYFWNIKVTQIYEDKAYDKSRTSLTAEDDEDDDLSSKMSFLSKLTFGNIFSVGSIIQRLFTAFAPEDSHKEVTSIQNDTDEVDTGTGKNVSVTPGLFQIVNGVNTDITFVPWQISLRMVYPPDLYSNESIQALIGENCTATEGIHFCGGSIIGNNQVLTAAHCFFGTSKVDTMKDLTLVKVIVGDTNRCHDDTSAGYNSSEYDIDKVTFHYGYDSTTLQHDLAIVTLKEQILFQHHIQPVKLAESDFVMVAGSRALSSGWGLTEPGDNYEVQKVPEVLQSNDHFTIQNESYCQQVVEESYGDNADNIEKQVKYEGYLASLFCTGSKPSVKEGLTGQGDSGGGIVMRQNDSTYIQIGVVSFALPYNTNSSFLEANTTTATQNSAKEPNCNKPEEEVDFFQSVSFYRPWIDLVLRA